MIVFVVTINQIVQPSAYVGLRPLCERYNLDYSSASKGKREWERDDEKLGKRFYKIIPVEVIKIKGRGQEGNRRYGEW